MQIVLLPDITLAWNNLTLPKVGVLIEYKHEIYKVKAHRGKQAICKKETVIKLEGK